MSSKAKTEKAPGEKPEEKKKKKKGSSPEALFSSNKFMLALSFVAAFFIWVVMSVSNGETVNYPVTEIPVTMELSEEARSNDLSVVTIDGMPIDDFQATVRVKGNSVTVGSLKASDIQVYGMNLGNVVASGSYTVTLMARQIGVKNNYDIVSVSPSEVKIVVDRNIISEFPIESQINATSPVEYYIGSPSLSQQSVTVSGPEQVLSKAVKAVVSADVEKELEETTTLGGLAVNLLDSSGNKIDDESITMSPAEVDATIPVLVKKKVPLTLEYLNAPANFDGGKLVTLEPSEIEIAAAADKIDSVTSILAGTIDFSTVSYGMSSMSLSLTMPEGVKNLNNIDNAAVNFDFSDYSTKSFVITKFTSVNVPIGLAAEYSDYERLTVRVIGPKAEVAELISDNLTASVDLSTSKIGTAVVPVNIDIDTATSCWVYGSYTVNVTVKDENDVSSVSSISTLTSSTTST